MTQIIHAAAQILVKFAAHKLDTAKVISCKFHQNLCEKRGSAEQNKTSKFMGKRIEQILSGGVCIITGGGEL